MRRIWRKAAPKPTPLVTMAMKKPRIRDIEEYAKKHKIYPVRLETALVRYSKDFLKKHKPLKIVP